MKTFTNKTIKYTILIHPIKRVLDISDEMLLRTLVESNFSIGWTYENCSGYIIKIKGDKKLEKISNILEKFNNLWTIST